MQKNAFYLYCKVKSKKCIECNDTNRDLKTFEARFIVCIRWKGGWVKTWELGGH